MKNKLDNYLSELIALLERDVARREAITHDYHPHTKSTAVFAKASAVPHKR